MRDRTERGPQASATLDKEEAVASGAVTGSPGTPLATDDKAFMLPVCTGLQQAPWETKPDTPLWLLNSEWQLFSAGEGQKFNL